MPVALLRQRPDSGSANNKSDVRARIHHHEICAFRDGGQRCAGSINGNWPGVGMPAAKGFHGGKYGQSPTSIGRLKGNERHVCLLVRRQSFRTLALFCELRHDGDEYPGVCQRQDHCCFVAGSFCQSRDRGEIAGVGRPVVVLKVVYLRVRTCEAAS
jgi:hypothetical protein